MLYYFVPKTYERRLKMEINFKEIIQHQSDQIITFSPDDVVVGCLVIHLPVDEGHDDHAKAQSLGFVNGD